MFLSTLSYLGGFGTFGQVLLALPMALDLLGPPSFLLLSLLFTLHHFLYSTLRLVLKNTLLAPLISFLSFISPLISSLCILLTLYYHLHPPSAPPTTALLPSPAHLLVNVLPYLYAAVLRWVSPLFTLLEGISTLLVIQVAGRVGKGWADEEEREEGVEWRGIVGLVAAALVYSAGLAGVVMSFPLSTTSAFPAFLLGAALTAVLFLSLIGFTLRRTNVLETSLVFVYVVYSAWLSGIEAAMDASTIRHHETGSPYPFAHSGPKRQSPLTPPSAHRLSFNANVADTHPRSAQTLPPHLLLSLIYRVAVLHLAARIVPVIRKTSMGWNDGMDEGSANGNGDGGRPGFWDGRSLGQEPPNMRVTTVVLSYRRAILIAVYTHLLLLDAGSQTWWRWLNIALFLAVWSLELLLDADDDADSVTRWKVD
ncbi:hypothetical protein JCM24511_02475 [Saitozyma sp. JCM 24511]|nr:hypothetical protein JCM24511_02475 [Saitozyma sp. JCM 24511]